jgi:hypothetical protein
MYREKVHKGYEPVLDDMGQPLTGPDGQILARETEKIEVLEDRPCCDLIPIENIRFDPGAKWNDVVKTTPYLIRCVPMYVDDVRQMMKSDNSKTGKPKWKEYDESVIRTAMETYDTTRQARERGKQDPLSDNNSLKEFDVVWCHENFIRIGGEEMVYWTLGTTEMLTEPMPLKEAYFHGQRPIVIGCAVLETHKPMPDSLVGIGSELQKEANDLTNQRMDNVRLVLNKRWIVKRGKQVDTSALMRNVPGGAIMVDDPELDLRPVDFQDVTGSSYQEQDRLNIDFDSLVGNFDQSSVQTNRKLNETVGGMNLAAGGASTLTEYLIRTFVETWVEQTLNQLVLLEQEYETNEVLLSLVSGADALKEFNLPQVTQEMLGGPMSVTVNVGMGATDPQKKMGKFIAALSSYGQAMQLSPDFDPTKLRTELFGLAGYKNAERFFKQQGNMPPEVMQMQQQMQQMGQVIQQLQQELQNKTQQTQIQAQTTLKKAAIDNTAKLEMSRMSQETAIDVANINSATDENTAYVQARTDIGKSVIQSNTQLKTAAINATERSMKNDNPLKEAKPSGDGEIMAAGRLLISVMNDYPVTGRK